MIQQLNTNLKQIVPYYSQALDLSLKTLKNPKQSANFVIGEVSNQIERTTENVRNLRKDLQNQIMKIVQPALDQLFNRAQKLLLEQNQRPSESDKKQMKKRFIKLFNKFLNDYIIFYAEQAKKHSLALVKRGKQYFYVNIFPLYITLKATFLVSKQILFELLENRIDDMRMTYVVSKDTVTMLIKGEFEEGKIRQKISTGMENFKQMTVKVAKKGLQIKVDKDSLYENFQAFTTKLLEIIREMREKGVQRIDLAKQKSAQLYKNVLNRIREKQITLRMEYKQLQDKKQQHSEQ